jgi:lipopolysaccharide transport system ATP-binding protein
MTLLTSDQDTFEQPQDDKVVLSVKNVSKRFCRDLKKSLFYGIQDIAGEVFGARRKDVELRKGEFWALNDVSFELRRGEALGLVGANGAGKTTLLRIISGLIKPDHGSVEVKGRVAPLIALGAGFNPILTGRENIYVNMSILGLSKEEIDDRFDQVVEFAEIGEAIDAPVQSYSSGMAARLGFASAIFTEPDILLIDEVLAVGDMKFRAKCYRRLAQLRERGISFILVSHSSVSVLSICNVAVYLSRGKVKIIDEVGKVISQYEKDLNIGNLSLTSDCQGVLSFTEDDLQPDLQIVTLGFKDLEGNILNPLITGNPAVFFVEAILKREFSDLKFSMIIKDISREGARILFLDSSNELDLRCLSEGKIRIEISLNYCAFIPGRYLMKVYFHCNNFHILDVVESFEFLVESNKNISQCAFYQPSNWSFNVSSQRSF